MEWLMGKVQDKRWSTKHYSEKKIGQHENRLKSGGWVNTSAPCGHAVPALLVSL